MNTLGCTAHNCVNNEGGLCGAEYILVEGDSAYTSSQTYCSNFRVDTIVNEVKAVTNTDFFGEIMQILSGPGEVKFSPNVSCSARKCFYNGDGKCEARNLIIVGNMPRESAETQCETFIESY
ncbi:hypothetical protein UT300003_20250 [Clostridium sardiniense]|uniref:DUF1540 domain-containing protein n=1 Tax=Clostridium sardiniense TaxID=29369 RepID=UPI0019584B11|nr:DUF1540 domain-containing protein [Clostridium sardiniense]MBM7833878.1 hypothetical protein [Clostridium sardiniense]